MRRRLGIAALACALWAPSLAPRGEARENLATERMLADIIQMSEQAAEQPARPIRTWAVLPQVGFSPEKGTNAGIKFTDRDVSLGALEHLTVDVDGNYALKRQQQGGLTLVAPSLLGNRLVAAVEAEYLFDPTKEFFGIGNNNVGPDALATHEYRLLNALGTLAARPFPRLTLALTGGFTDVRIRRGRLEDDTPSTVDAFPDLAGIRGGRTNPIAFSIVFNNREEITRPTRGWNVIAKVQHVNRSLGNEFQFTRYIFDASYLYPLMSYRQVLGVRVGGEFIDAKRRQLPFYELASLGGSRDLRGFFQDRFLGTSRVMINAEYRQKLVDFDFFDIWRVRLDGVAFGDMGRVFFDQREFSREFEVDSRLVPRVFRDFRYSYGGGLRIALGEAILARIDVGFSNEETGLTYLTFGHIF